MNELHINAVSDLIDGLIEAMETNDLDRTYTATGLYDLLMDVAQDHPEDTVRNYLMVTLKQIEGV